jgi:hypothetical protein
MCFMQNRRAIDPIRIVIHRQSAQNGALVETQTLALAKVTGKTRAGEHISSHKFVYPIGQTVYDPNARVGDHANSLHFLPAVEYAPDYSSYGSCIVIVVPGPHLWDLPVASGEQPAHCLHSNSCTPLFCLTCQGLTLDDLKHDAFWRDLPLAHRRSGVSAVSNRHAVLPVSRNNVWHEQVHVYPHQLPQYAYRGNAACRTR